MHLKNALRVMALALFVFGISQAASAQGRWMFLGDKHVDGHNDHDKISIGSKEGTFRQLQIRVKMAPVVFKRVVVHFGNGTDEELEFRDRMMAVVLLGRSICAEPIGLSRALSSGTRKRVGASDGQPLNCTVVDPSMFGMRSVPGAVATG